MEEVKICQTDVQMFRLSQLLGVAYCWGIPRGIELGFSEVGEGMKGGRLSTRGFLAEWSVGEMGR